MAGPEEKEASAPQGEGNGGESAEKGVRTTVVRGGNCECTIRVKADGDYLKQRYEERLRRLQEETQLPGFRAGKAPMMLLLRKFAEGIKNEILTAVASEGYDEAVEKNDLTVVTRSELPDVEEMEWEAGEPAEFEFKCEVLPDIELEEAQYKGIRAEVPRLEVTEEMFREESDRFARQLASWEPVESRGVDWDDYVRAEVSTVPEAGEEARWREELGFHPRDGRIGPFLVEGLKGTLMEAKVGETLQVEAELPEGEELQDKDLKALAGKPLKLNLAIRAVHRERIPEINDELARKLNFKDIEEIHSFLRQRLESRLEAEKDRATRYSVVETLLNNIPVEMPPAMVERAAREEQRKLMIRALRSGSSQEEAENLAQQNAERSREAALRGLKASFLLRQIADRERIYVLDSEVQEQVRAVAATHEWTERRTERYMEKNDLMHFLRSDLREEKTTRFLVENARLEEVAPEQFARGVLGAGEQLEVASDQ